MIARATKGHTHFSGVAIREMLRLTSVPGLRSVRRKDNRICVNTCLRSRRSNRPRNSNFCPEPLHRRSNSYIYSDRDCAIWWQPRRHRNLQERHDCFGYRTVNTSTHKATLTHSFSLSSTYSIQAVYGGMWTSMLPHVSDHVTT